MYIFECVYVTVYVRGYYNINSVVLMFCILLTLKVRKFFDIPLEILLYIIHKGWTRTSLCCWHNVNVSSIGLYLLFKDN